MTCRNLIYSSSCAAIGSVTQALIDESPLQLDTPHLAADRTRTARVQAIVRSVGEILNLESGICAPTDTATRFASTPRATRLPRSIASDIFKKGSTSSLSSFVGR